MTVAGSSLVSVYKHSYSSNLLNYATAGTNVTSSTTANAFGAYVELINSTGSDSIVLLYATVQMPTASSTAGTQVEIELARGPVGAEARFIGWVFPDMGADHHVVVPLNRLVPPNSRITARARDSSTTALSYRISLYGIKVGNLPRISGVSYPVPIFHENDFVSHYTTANSILLPGSADVFGSWVQLMADSGSRPLLIVFAAVSADSLSGRKWEVEIGIGASGNEIPICSVGLGKITPRRSPTILPVYRVIPSSSRVVARVRDDFGLALNYRVALNMMRI